MWSLLKKWWKNRNVDHFSPAPWQRDLPKFLCGGCPVCGDPVLVWRMLITEDLAQVSKLSGVHPNVIRVYLGREYLHADSKYCTERFVEYTSLAVPKCETIREAKPEDGYDE